MTSHEFSKLENGTLLISREIRGGVLSFVVGTRSNEGLRRIHSNTIFVVVDDEGSCKSLLVNREVVLVTAAWFDCFEIVQV